MSDKISKRYTIKNFVKKHEGFLTAPSLRWMIFKADENGLSKSGAIERIGKSVFINEDKFFAWLESQNQ